MNITFLGGMNCIGGNKFLLEDKDTRIFLDFGQSFNLLEDYFSDWLRPRSRFGLRDYFALDLVKYIPGLYNEKALEPCEEEWEESNFQGVFISHVHMDHTKQLEWLDEKIPVYLGETTLNILDSWSKTSKISFGDHPFNIFHTGDVIKINDWEIRPIHVDHSVPAAYGYIIYTPECTIGYTGDYRIHGPWKHLSLDLIKRMEEAELDLFNEQGFGPAFGRVLLSAIYTLIEAGYPPEAVLVELYMSNEMSYTYKKMAEIGLIKQVDFHSQTSQYGAMSRGIRYRNIPLKTIMHAILKDIQDGSFTKEWEKKITKLKFKAIKFFATKQKVNKLEQQVRKNLGLKRFNIYEEEPPTEEELKKMEDISEELKKFEIFYE